MPAAKPEKPIVFMGTSLEDIRAFPLAARQEIGFDLRRVQQGLLPRDGKAMKTVGAGAMEIRVQHQGQWRVIYVAKFGGKVHVLHAFVKKTRQTRQADIDVAKARYQQAARE
ncbi:MAG: type II toxin-antitoxin system RelE/ParE family toxin [Gammaproteobacteria bacterium]|nr:MAG: type II toxin-antitoxin system RelE/ParE family toxin [Gammaproteobacteria bacterium]